LLKVGAKRIFMNLAVYFPLFMMGFTFTITQVVVIRELLIVFTGNELSIAIILANWLILEAAGSVLIRKKVANWKQPAKKYAFFQFLVAFLLPLTIFAIRSLRDFMGLAWGEGANLWQIFLGTLPILAPLGICDGLLFATGCMLYASWAEKGAVAIGKVYFLEALGAGMGGILYTFLFIPFLNSFQVAFLLGAANLSSGLLLFTHFPQEMRNKKLIYLWLICLFINLWFIFPNQGDPWEKISQQRLWKGVKIIDSRWSPYGNVLVGQREEQLSFFANGIPICNIPTPSIPFVEELIHFPLLLLPDPQKVLIIGGGFGGAIYEILKHPVKEIHYAELDPLIIQLLKEYLTPLTQQEMANPRVKVHNLDGRLFIKNTAEKFDALILNLPPPYSLELNRFYTVNFFREIFRVLKNEGLLVLVSPGSESYLGPENKELNLNLWSSLRAVFPDTYIIFGDPNYLLASPGRILKSLKADNLISSKRERKVSTKFLTEFHIQQKLAAPRQEWFKAALLSGDRVRLNRDDLPAGLFYGLAYWHAQFHPYIQPFWRLVGNMHLGHCLIILGLIIFFIFLLEKRRKKEVQKGCLIWVVTTTGFLGTAMSILLIFSFQTIYGYAYHWIGLLVAAFMVGLALGSFAMVRFLKEHPFSKRQLIKVEIFILLFLITVLASLFFIYAQTLRINVLKYIKVAYFLFSLISGFSVGLEFSLVSKIFAHLLKEIGRPAGLLYASDLTGAWCGSLLVGVILIPILGILPTCTVIMLLKFTSLFWLRISALPDHL
jgi:spermidine synthase